MAKRQDFKRAGGRDTPRKPKRQRGKRPTLAGTPPLGYLNSFYCPVCGDHLFSVYDGDLARPDYHFRVSDGWNYCRRCGQALDLGEFKAGKEEKGSGQQDNGDFVFT